MKSFKQYLKEKSFSHSGEGFKGGPDRETWRGPHEGKELEMMHAGVKPAGVVNHHEYHKNFKQHVDSGKFISKPIDFGLEDYKHRPYYIIGLKGQERRVDKLHQEFMKPTRDHGKIGRLLGYSKDHIRTWMKSRK